MWKAVRDGNRDGGVIIAATSNEDLCHQTMFQINKVRRIPTKQDTSFECQAGE